MKTLVIGHRGLIGSSISGLLAKSDGLYEHAREVRWAQPELASRDLASLISDFRINAGNDSWTLYWCAGKGHLRSVEKDLVDEDRHFESVLAEISKWDNRQGVLVLCSSAGAIWANSPNVLIDEDSPISGKTPYALLKIRQERLLSSFAREFKIKGLIARLSSIYGTNQDLMKTQGLITRLCHSAVTRVPAEIFVPLETTRNYLSSDDASKMLVRLARTLHSEVESPTVWIRIVSSRDNHSVATLCRAVEVVSRQDLLIRSKISDTQGLYPLHFRLRSHYQRDFVDCESTTILAGVSQVYHEILRRLQRGVLT